MEDEITGIFLEILMVCQEMTLIGGEFFAIDGCKLPSNASKESSGTFEDLKKKKLEKWSYPVSVDSSGLVSWVTPKCFSSYSTGESYFKAE